MHDDHVLIERRLARSLDRIWPAVYSGRHDLDVAMWAAPGEPVPAAEALRAIYQRVRVGDAWGPPWGSSPLRDQGAIRVDGDQLTRITP